MPTRLSLKITTRCHSVRSLRSPELRSRQLSEVARLRLAIRVPSLVERISGSRPRLPTRMTLLTLPAMGSPLVRIGVREGGVASYQVPRMFPPESYPPILGTAIVTGARRKQRFNAEDAKDAQRTPWRFSRCIAFAPSA